MFLRRKNCLITVATARKTATRCILFSKRPRKPLYHIMLLSRNTCFHETYGISLMMYRKKSILSLFIFNNQLKWRNLVPILRGTDPTVSATASCTRYDRAKMPIRFLLVTRLNLTTETVSSVTTSKKRPSPNSLDREAQKTARQAGSMLTAKSIFCSFSTTN